MFGACDRAVFRLVEWDLKLNVLLISDYGLNGVNKTTKVVLDDYLNFDHVQYIIQRGGSTVLVPYALKVRNHFHKIKF